MTMTPKDFREMSLQEIFNYSTRGIIQQGGPCIDDTRGHCVYANGDKHCAAGWVLPDYIEGRSVSSILRDLYGETATQSQRDLLEKLQTCHDNAAQDYRVRSVNNPVSFWRLWRQALERFLDHYRYDLDGSVLREIPHE